MCAHFMLPLPNSVHHLGQPRQKSLDTPLGEWSDKEIYVHEQHLSLYQSGFRKQHSTVSAAMKVVNDIVEGLSAKNYCTALFIDLSMAFDTVDNGILCQR